MTNLKKRRILNKIIFLLITIGFFFFFPSRALAASLTLSPDSLAKKVGEEFSLSILLDTESDSVSGVQLVLNYDPSILEGKSISIGAILPTQIESKIGDGKVSLGAGKLGGGFQGKDNLATLSFRGLKKGRSEITFSGLGSETKVAQEGTGTSLSTKVNKAIISLEEGVGEMAEIIPGITPTPTPKEEIKISPTPTAPEKISLSKEFSSVEVSKNRAIADGSDIISIKVIIRDTKKKIIKNKKPIIEVSGQGNNLSDPVLIGNEWIGELSSTIPEEKTITVKVEKITLASKPKVSFFKEGEEEQKPIIEPLTVSLKVNNLATRAENIILKKADTLTLEGETIPGGKITLYLYSTGYQFNLGADEKGSWSFNLTPNFLERGEHSIFGEVTDAIGNKSEKTKLVTFILKGNFFQESWLPLIGVGVILVFLIFLVLLKRPKKEQKDLDVLPLQ